MRKSYVINLNPEENPNIGYLDMELLCNPFPKTAICVGPIGTPDPKFSQMVYEMDVETHLKAGVTLEYARSWMKGILSEEVIDIALSDAVMGDRIEIIVDSDKMELYKRKLPSPEKTEQTG